MIDNMGADKYLGPVIFPLLGFLNFLIFMYFEKFLSLLRQKFTVLLEESAVKLITQNLLNLPLDSFNQSITKVYQK